MKNLTYIWNYFKDDFLLVLKFHYHKILYDYNQLTMYVIYIRKILRNINLSKKSY